MKTTVEIPDALNRQVKARAALHGQTIKDFLVEAVRDKLTSRVGKKGETQENNRLGSRFWVGRSRRRRGVSAHH